jgi:hypothetical protein
MANDLMTKQAIMLAQAGEDISHMINPKYKPEERELIMQGARRGRDISRFLIQEESMTPDRGLGWDLVDAVNSAGAGFENAIINTAVAPYNLIKKATSKKGEFNPIEIDTDKYNLQGASKNKFAKGLGELGGDILAGAVIPGGAVTKATKYAPKLEKLISKSDKLWGKLSKTQKAKVLAVKGADIGAEGAMMGALYGARDKDTSIPEDMLYGAGINYPAAAVFKAPSYLTTKYLQRMAKKAMKGESEALTPGQVKKIDQEIGNAPVDFGAISGNKAISGLYRDVIANLPFSSSKEKAGEVIGGLNKAGEDLKKVYGGNIDETEIPGQLISHMSEKQKGYEEETGKKFLAAQKIAEDSNVNMTEVDDLINEASKVYNSLKGREAIPGAQLKFIKKIVDLKEMTKADNMNTSSYPFTPGKKIISFNKLDSIRKDLGTFAREAALDKDKTLYANLAKLETLTHNSIEKSLEKGGAEEAVALWKAGRQLHKNNVIPYRKPEIQKIIQGKKSNEKIHDVLLKGDPENQKVFGDLSPDLTNKVLRMRLFGNAIEEVGGKQTINSNKLIREYSKLNEFQKKRSFTPEQRQQLDRYVQLHKVAGNSKLILEPPKTGKYVYNAAIKLAALGAPALAGFKSHDEEYAPSGTPTGAAAYLLGALLSKKGSKYFTSRDGLRKDYIRGRADQGKISKSAQKTLARMIARGALGDNPFED